TTTALTTTITTTTSTSVTTTTTTPAACAYQSTGGANGSGWWCKTLPSTFDGKDLKYVATWFGVCYQTLAADNNQVSDITVHNGDILKIPNGSGCPLTSTTTTVSTTTTIPASTTT